MRVHQGGELPRHHQEALGRLDGRDRRRARVILDERHLAEEGPRSLLDELGLLAVHLPADRDPAAQDQVERGRRVALLDDGVPGLVGRRVACSTTRWTVR